MLGVLLGALFAFGFGGVLLILVLGAQRIERELQARAAEEIGAQAERLPRFFMVTPPPGPQDGPPDRLLLWQLQQYLRAEESLADEFVLQPSVESLLPRLRQEAHGALAAPRKA